MSIMITINVTPALYFINLCQAIKLSFGYFRGRLKLEDVRFRISLIYCQSEYLV